MNTPHSIQITIDNFPIYAALVLTAVAALAYVIAAFRPAPPHPNPLPPGEREYGTRAGRVAYHAAFGAIAYAAVYMLQALLSGARYDIAYVINNSSPRDGLLYQISAFWAGQQGSLLFWALAAAAVGLILVAKYGKTVPLAVAFWSLVQVFFLALLVIDDPFARFHAYQPGMVGAGLNPLLKNPWMAIHPPVVFLGYALLTVPAALAVAAIISGEISQWAKRSLPWALAGWAALGAGILLGMIWSYEVLGWGGYWAWDPVENGSLVPWLVGTALIHGLILQRGKGLLSRANVVLAFAVFLTVLYATYLTRSGVLGKGVSVHSFGESGLSKALTGGLAFFAVLCLGLFAIRWGAMRAKLNAPKLHGRDIALLTGVVLPVMFAVVVLVGTSYSVFTKLTVEPSFYSLMSLPLGALIAALIAIATVARWSRRSAAHIAHAGVVMLIAGVLLSTSGSSQVLTLERNGDSVYSSGRYFQYRGRKAIPDGRQLVLKLTQGSKTISAAITTRFSRDGAVTTPYIASSLAGDIYVAPRDIKAVSVSPSASMIGGKWKSMPVPVPESKAALTLVGLRVESDAATIEYRSPEGRTREFTVSADEPAEVDGYTFEFDGYQMPEDNTQHSFTAGVNLIVTGNGLAEKAIIEVSTKPFVWLVWLGGALIIVGAIHSAATRRAVIQAKVEDTVSPE